MNPSLFRLATALLLSPLLLIAADDVQVRVGDVEDRRTTGKFFGGLDVELRLTGDTMEDVKMIRPVVKSAVDDTGRNLLQEDKDSTFQDSGNSRAIHLKLRNPARKAAAIKEIRGEVQLFLPQNDPAANVAVDLSTQSGKAVQSDVVRKAGIDVMPLTKAEYDTRKAKAVEQKSKPAGEADIAGAFEKAFTGMLSGFMSVSENSVVLLVRDPNSKLVNVEFESGQGEKIRSRGRSSSKREGEETRIYDFEKRPDRIILQLSTEKSVISAPLNLKDIPLP